MNEPAFDILERGFTFIEVDLKVVGNIHFQVCSHHKKEGAVTLADEGLKGYIICRFPFSCAGVMEAYSFEDLLKTCTNLIGDGLGFMVEEDDALINHLVMLFFGHNYYGLIVKVLLPDCRPLRRARVSRAPPR